METAMIYAVVMAGGSGTRFWPKSVEQKPKQFHRLFGEETLLQATFERLEDFVPRENHLVVTNDQYVTTVREQLPYLGKGRVIAEPVSRNTAPCVAAAAQLLLNNDPEALMLVLPADHFIADQSRFREVLSAAADVANNRRTLVTIGIRPDRPETGYGYIRYDKRGESAEDQLQAVPVENFTEKPDPETARSFLKAGNYLWNSGMFVWRADVILESFRQHQPETYESLKVLRGEGVGQEEVNRFYRDVSSISIDYGIMEHAENVEVLPGEFGWSDVGSWQAVHMLGEKDENGNVVNGGGPFLSVDSSDNLVETENGKLVALVGVDQIAVVETGQTILVCNLSRSQDVRSIVDQLKADSSLSEYL